MRPLGPDWARSSYTNYQLRHIYFHTNRVALEQMFGYPFLFINFYIKVVTNNIEVESLSLDV